MNFLNFALLAQDELPDGAEAAGAAVIGVFVLIYLLMIAAWIAGWWKCFTKAGKPGWAAIIPIYNFIVTLEIVGKPIWWILLCFIPCVNFVIYLLVFIDLAKAFGKSPAFGIGLLFLPFIFFPILGFGDARYVGPPK